MEITKKLEDNIVEPAQTERASRIVFVEKEGDNLQICVKYSKLDAPTKRDSYPAPRMDERIDSLGEATIFSALDV